MNRALQILSVLAATTPAFADDRSTDEAPTATSIEPPAAIASPAIVPVPFAAAKDSELVAIAPRAASAYQHAVSLQLMTISATGIAIQLERGSNVRKKISVALAIGGRSSAQGDYESRTVGAGLEVKRWLRRPEPMTGWYVAARTDLARTKVADRTENRGIGSLTTWTTGLSTGYRWVLFHKVELTPSIGAAMVVEGGTMSPTTTRRAGVFGLTAGYIF
jgi:hypothetical protein